MTNKKKVHIMADKSSTSGSVKERLESTLKSFKQQRLPAWKPVITCGTVIPFFFLLSLALVIIGSGLLYLSTRVQEFELDYTHCWPLFGTKSCAQALEDEPNSVGCKCWYKFELSSDFDASVFVYYGLKNYYQNHRLYENSFDEQQLMGRVEASSSCQPFQYKEVGGRQLPIVPCGTIANSLFNDTFRIWRHEVVTNWAQEVPLLYTGISWPSDQYFFRNPSIPLQMAFANFTSPPNWRRNVWQLDPKNPDNNGLKNEALIVWFRTAAFPEFRKLYARVNHLIGSVYQNSLPKGHYFLEIEYNYPITQFYGAKSLIISNTSWMGGKNLFLGIAYIVCGVVLFFTTAILLFIHKRYGMSHLERLAISEKTPYFSERRLRTRENDNAKFLSKNNVRVNYFAK